MSNRLTDEASPYLLQHRDNPVAWWPWGPDAFAEAQRTDRPVLLSIGYAACHWCHVMAHESFEDDAIAALMNELFVNIKVDREERPEIDQIYMAALHALGEQGGWPLTMFLTPDAEPFWGGTYFPPEDRYGRPGFPRVLNEIARVYRDERHKIASATEPLIRHLKVQPPATDLTLDRELLDKAADQLLGLMDLERGGTQGAPKFPQTGLFECLWRTGLRTGTDRFTAAIHTTLSAICQGGIYDHIGGGFARYSVDAEWLVPHFEKMLYDNGQLIALLTAAADGAHAPLYRDRIEATIDWLVRDMREPGSGFASSLDADSEGVEGKYYVWTPEEVRAVLDAPAADLVLSTYDITPAGNFEGRSIPNRLRSSEPLPAKDEATLAEARAALLAERTIRIAPAKDDKILADWNGLAIAAIALAGFRFGRPDWTELAADVYAAVRRNLMREDRFAHARRGERVVFPGLATDYAFMIKAALDLHTATFDPAYLADAEAWPATLDRHHREAGGALYFLPADDADDLIVRPRSDRDDATPSASGTMAANLIRLWRLTGRDTYRADADAILEDAAALVATNLFASASYLNALDLRLGAVDVAIVAPTADDAGALLDAVRRVWTPNLVVSLHDPSRPIPEGHPAHGKTMEDGRPTAYVCRGTVCSLPVTGADELAAQIAT